MARIWNEESVEPLPLRDARARLGLPRAASNPRGRRDALRELWEDGNPRRGHHGALGPGAKLAPEPTPADSGGRTSAAARACAGGGDSHATYQPARLPLRVASSCLYRGGRILTQREKNRPQRPSRPPVPRVDPMERSQDPPLRAASRPSRTGPSARSAEARLAPPWPRVARASRARGSPSAGRRCWRSRPPSTSTSRTSPRAARTWAPWRASASVVPAPSSRSRRSRALELRS